MSGSTGLRIVTFKIDPPTLEALDRLASTLGVSRSDLIREAINLLLSEYGVKVERAIIDMKEDDKDLVTIEITI